MTSALADARKKQGLTQSQLGAKVGLSPQAICDMENGRTKGNIATWRRIAHELKVRLDVLTSDIG